MSNIFYIIFISTWLTHVIHCFNEEAWSLLIAGAVFFPIAIVNGFFIWFS